jgi:MFS family permease
LIAIIKHRVEPIHLRVAWLCGVVLFLEGYDIAAAGYAIPSLVDAWRMAPSEFTQALTAGNVGLLLGSIGAGLLGDRLGRRPTLICCVTMLGAFSLLSALVSSPVQLAGVRFLTGLGLGGGIPLAIALASDFAPPMAQGRVVILMFAGVPIGFALGGLLASRLVPVFGWPAIFVVGGVLPLAMVPPLALLLPESVALSASARWRNPIGALFREGLAPSTALLWAMNLLNLLSNYLILLWTPAILHDTGVSPSQAIFGTSMYGFGIILGALLTAPVADSLGAGAGADVRWPSALLRAGNWFARCAVLVILGYHLWRWNGHWRLPSRSQLAIGTDLSTSHSLDWRRLGSRLRACRHHWRTSPWRRTARARVSSAAHIRDGRDSGIRRDRSDGDPRAIAAQLVEPRRLYSPRSPA